MLRASSESQADLSSIVDDEPTGAGVDAGAELLAYTDAVLSASPSDILKYRSRLAERLGDAAMVDAAAVIANFQRMVRIADGTGIPLDGPVLMMTQNI